MTLFGSWFGCFGCCSSASEDSGTPMGSPLACCRKAAVVAACQTIACSCCAFAKSNFGLEPLTATTSAQWLIDCWTAVCNQKSRTSGSAGSSFSVGCLCLRTCC